MNTWVVGGTSGIGKAVAKRLLDEWPGSRILATGREYDVRQPQQLEAFLGDPSAERQCIEGLVYSAGANYLDWQRDLDPYIVEEIFKVNAIGFLNVMQALQRCRYLPRRVVVIGSDAAWRPMRTSAAYCASKAALEMMVKCMARELGEGCVINVVAPGMTAPTKMQKYVDARTRELRGWTEQQRDEYEKRTTLRRADPREVAEVVYRVLSTQTTYMSGSVITVNGGR